ncbi:hypothetical protein F5890DRAFT_1496937 [Lentinula detonsa]|uniref:Uncharacterized protein n=1 Tax=Lentinula detonsa TaxID=2804962 RepID=A0AA38UWZ4_9AGAR|nr:hypothetical protein F5890DRAFT_1496937 [Lentinula detonsa]
MQEQIVDVQTLRARLPLHQVLHQLMPQALLVPTPPALPILPTLHLHPLPQELLAPTHPVVLVPPILHLHPLPQALLVPTHPVLPTPLILPQRPLPQVQHLTLGHQQALPAQPMLLPPPAPQDLPAPTQPAELEMPPIPHLRVQQDLLPAQPTRLVARVARAALQAQQTPLQQQDLPAPIHLVVRVQPTQRLHRLPPARVPIRALAALPRVHLAQAHRAALLTPQAPLILQHLLLQPPDAHAQMARQRPPPRIPLVPVEVQVHPLTPVLNPDHQALHPRHRAPRPVLRLQAALLHPLVALQLRAGPRREVLKVVGVWS